jgi:hypothetical protein
MMVINYLKPCFIAVLAITGENSGIGWDCKQNDNR